MFQKLNSYLVNIGANSLYDSWLVVVILRGEIASVNIAVCGSTFIYDSL